MNELVIRVPDNFHLHLRHSEMLRNVLPFTTNFFRRALVMGNVPPITRPLDLIHYRREIQSACRLQKLPQFQPLMTFMLTPNTTPRMVWQFKRAGAIACKVMFVGTTTGSQYGIAVDDIPCLVRTFRAMELAQLVVAWHMEKPMAYALSAEDLCREIIQPVIEDFPFLRHTIEHVSREATIQWIEELPLRVAGTITPQHLTQTYAEVLGRPHNYCLPTQKLPEDKLALRKAATSGNPKWFAGSDSAPHTREKKLQKNPAAGVFSEPAAVATYAEVFEEEGALGAPLEHFLSVAGARHYRLPLNKGKLRLFKLPWRVLEEIDRIVPWRAGEELSWQAVRTFKT